MLTFLIAFNLLTLTVGAVAIWYARRTVREARGVMAYVRSARHDVKTMHDKLTAEPVLLPFTRPQLRIAETGDSA